MMEITNENVKNVIENYLNVEISDFKMNFFDLGILDSFESINLIITLEKSFGIQIEALDFADNNKFNLEQIVLYLNEKRS